MSEQSVASARAAVLVYDSNLKKWSPSGTSAGLSKVHIYHHTENNTFRVVGRKIQDHEVVLNCSILKGFKYFQATPLFHQWRDKHSQVFGLNFHSKEDAETFALAMERVVDILGHTSVYLSNRSSQSQPLYQTIGHSGVSIDDYAEYRGWANSENGDKKSNTSDYSSGSEYGHYRGNHGNHSSHPTTPGSIPSPSAYSQHRASSAPSVAQQPLSIVPSPQCSVPPPPPPPPPVNSSLSGLATLPRMHLRPPNSEQDMTENSFAAALASAKLKKTPKASEVVSNEKPAALKGMGCIMDEMTRTLARRRAQTDSSLEVDGGDKYWKSPNRSIAEESPTRSDSEGGGNNNHKGGQIVVDVCELQKIKQEILAEMKNEVHKMKQDIIEAIRKEINRR